MTPFAALLTVVMVQQNIMRWSGMGVILPDYVCNFAQHLVAVSRFVPRAKSNPFAFESVLTCFPLGSLRLVLPVHNMPHESFPTTSDFDLMPHLLSPSVRSRLLPAQRPQRTHASEDDCVTGHHVADH